MFVASPPLNTIVCSLYATPLFVPLNVYNGSAKFQTHIPLIEPRKTAWNARNPLCVRNALFFSPGRPQFHTVTVIFDENAPRISI